MSRIQKTFDVVKMMRVIRDDLPNQIKGMPLKEERWSEKAAQYADAVGTTVRRR